METQSLEKKLLEVLDQLVSTDPNGLYRAERIFAYIKEGAKLEDNSAA